MISWVIRVVERLAQKLIPLICVAGGFLTADS
jgi:hypothetical protein